MTPRTIVSFLATNGSAMSLYYTQNFIDDMVIEAGETVFMTLKDGTYLFELDRPSDAEASVAYKVMGIRPTEIESADLKKKVIVPEIHLAMLTASPLRH